MRDTAHWVGTWTAAPAPAEGAAFSNHALRMIPRVSIGGSRLRVRISNAYGTRPLAIGAACVGHTVIMLGTNDLRNRNGKPEEEVTAPQMIAGLKQFAVRGQARGIRVIGGTLTPFENETFLPGAWNPKREAVRQAVNEWLRQTEAFDAIVDRPGAARPRPSDPDAADLRLR